MTYETLLFLRALCNKVSIPVADPEFRYLATQMLNALNELDKEIADASDLNGRDLPHT